MKFLVSMGAQIIFVVLAIGFIKTEDRNSLKRYTRDWIKKYKEFNDILNSGAGKQTAHVSYLTPFPRVGRGGAVTWDLEPGYPRVPNALLSNNEERIRRTGVKNMNTGLWFGPRLGRVQKRADGFMDDAWNYIILRDIPTYRHIPKYTPRLGRESQENMDDDTEDMNQTPAQDRA